jgi:hypothetical protein
MFNQVQLLYLSNAWLCILIFIAIILSLFQVFIVSCLDHSSGFLSDFSNLRLFYFLPYQKDYWKHKYEYATPLLKTLHELITHKMNIKLLSKIVDFYCVSLGTKDWQREGRTMTEDTSERPASFHVQRLKLKGKLPGIFSL